MTNLSPQTTKGDLIGFSTLPVRHSIPSDYGNFIADSSQGDGIRNTTYSQNQGKPGKTYIQYSDFENGATTGWSLGTTGTLTNNIPTGSPTFGSGASGNLSITTASSIIDGTSLELVSSAATTSGNMVSTAALPIDSEGQAKTLNFKFSYTVVSGASNIDMSGTSTNSFGVACYDVTNSAWLSATGQFNLVQKTGVGFSTGTCTTVSTTASLRFIIYNANATAGAATLGLDNFWLGTSVIPPAWTTDF